MNSTVFLGSNLVLQIVVLLSAFLFTGTVSRAQGSIRGRVADTQKNNLPSATVILLATDSVMVSGDATDGAGGFRFDNIQPGIYIISASMIGYSKQFSGFITVNDTDVQIPDLILEDHSAVLDEVSVKGDRQRFDQKLDRLVINLEGSITSSGNTIAEVLQKSPGVVVNRQNNSISINGKSGVRVMVNNKVMQLPADALVQMLDGMSASNVEKIELITAPSSEYDAEGNGGIIHIVMKAKEDFGTNVSFGLMAGARWAENFGANFNLQHRNKNLAYFLDYSLVLNHNLHILKSWRLSPDESFSRSSHTYSHRENRTTQQNLSAGFEWQVTKNTLLNFLFTGYDRNWRLNGDTQDISLVRMDSTVSTLMDVYESNVWKSATGSLGLQTKIDSKNEIGFTIDYLFYHNDNPSSYDNIAIVEEGGTETFSQISLDKTTPIRSFIAKIDYKYKLSPSWSWEAGVKSVTSKLNNDVVVQELVADSWTVDPRFTSSSTLDEAIYSGYLSTKLQIGKLWQMNGGLRFEHTRTRIGGSPDIGSIERKYGNFFPAISIKKSLGEEKDFEFSYTRRITRPTYNDIAPYVFFWSPTNFSAGNTSLYPAVSDALIAGYRFKQWTASLQYSNVKNEIAMMQGEIDTDDNLIYRSQNLKYLNTLAGTVNYSTAITGWWDFQGNLIAQFQEGKTSTSPGPVTMQLFGMSMNVVNIFKLPRDFVIEISGMYQSRSLSGSSEFLPVGSLNAGIQKNLGDKGVIRLSADDILYTNLWRIRTDSPESGLDTYFYYDWHNQFIRLTYTRNLGNAKLKSLKPKTGSDEERRRID